MKFFTKLYLTSHDDYIIGPGRIKLLQYVLELGSLHQAAQKIGMSYRWAWGRIKDAEKNLGTPLLVANPDKTNRAKILSQEALELLAWYSNTQKKLEETLEKHRKDRPLFLTQKFAQNLDQDHNLSHKLDRKINHELARECKQGIAQKNS